MNSRMSAAAVILLTVLIAAPAFSQASGADTYKAKCAMCHGADGLATSTMAKNMKIQSFKAPALVKATDAQFIASTKNGKGTMKGYAGKLTDAQIMDVVAYIRTLQT
jgi:mono/diheme cytochrome c family protein